MLNDSVDPDDDCGAPNAGTPNPQCMFNDTADLDDDFDGIYDHWDVDDDNDGIWDYFEIDVNDDLDDDANTQPPGNFFTGTNCFDNDDDGTDTDPDEESDTDQDDGIRERTFFHGTSAENAANILRNGFKCSTNGTLGPGIYMSKDISKVRGHVLVKFGTGVILRLRVRWSEIRLLITRLITTKLKTG